MAQTSGESETAKGQENFLRQFRDLNTREFKRITAGQFINVWNHYDTDGKWLLTGRPSVCLFVRLSVRSSVNLSVRPFVCPFVHLSVRVLFHPYVGS